METVLLYGIKVTVCSGVLLVYYDLFLKDRTFHQYNRFYLLSALVISLFIPLVRIEDFTVEVNENVYRLVNSMQNFAGTGKHEENGGYRILVIIIAAVSAGLLIRFLCGIFKIRQLKRAFAREEIDGINFYRTDLADAPFSYFKNLFWKNAVALDSDPGRQILKHELVHIQHCHTADKMIAEVIAAVFWFNPFCYLMKKELRLIHEYLADHESVKHSGTELFAKMLLESHFPGMEAAVTSHFTTSDLKKRLSMIRKPKTKYGYGQRILALPLVCTLAFAYMVNARNNEIRTINTAVTKDIAHALQDTVRPKPEIRTGIKETAGNGNTGITSAINGTDENEYARFYRRAENRSREAARQKAEAKEEMTALINSERKALAFEEKFPENRDYEKNPLTEAEKQVLKTDAEKIMELTQKRADNKRENIGLFKFEKLATKIFDSNGREIRTDDRSPVGNVTLMTVSVEGPELYVNGKKVSREEFLAHQMSFKNAPDAPANIKLFTIESVGDNKRSYAKKMEIITN